MPYLNCLLICVDKNKTIYSKLFVVLSPVVMLVEDLAPSQSQLPNHSTKLSLRNELRA